MAVTSTPPTTRAGLYSAVGAILAAPRTPKRRTATPTTYRVRVAVMASHMTADEFRRHGHQLVDWVADYWSGLGERRVTPDLRPGAIASLLPTQAPDKGEGFDAIVADLDTVVT